MYKFLSKPVIVLAVVLFCGCSEKDQPEIKANEIPVTFNVSTLNVDTQPMSRATSSGAAIWSVVNTVGYYIYNVKDSKLHRSGKVSYTPGVDVVPDNTGQFTEKLAPGTYTIVFYALGKGNGYATFAETSTLSSSTIINYKDKEVFYHKGNVVITATSTEIEIPLSRKSAMLRINITDEATPDIGKVEIKFDDAQKWNVYYAERQSYPTYTFDGIIVDNRLQTFEYYFAFSGTQTSVSILIYDQASALLSKTDIVVPLMENRRTIVSGELFSKIGGKEINISIDDVWGDDIEHPLN